MIGGDVLVALAAVGVSLAVGGAILQFHRTWWSGTLLIVAGVVVVAAVGLEDTGHSPAAQFGFTLAAALVLPLALTAYPRLRWRHPVDYVAVATLLGSGLLAVVRWGDSAVVATMGLVIGTTLAIHTWWRIEHGTGERWAIVWMSLGAAVPGLVAGLALFVAPETIGMALALSLFVMLAPSMVVGVARPEVVDVRGLVVQTVVFTLAGIVYLAGFVSVAALWELLGGETPVVGALAVVGLLVATTFHPARVMLRGVVDELLFGHRPDPLGAATDVVGNIGDDPVLALRAIRTALVLPYAEIEIDGVQVASSGARVTHTRRLALHLGDSRSGVLVLGLRAGDLRLSAGDEQALQLVAPLLAQTLRVSNLAADLQVSREATVTALEDERRRLRRDLHDGLGPRLSGIAFTADAARNSLHSDLAGADALLLSVRAETATAIDEIRRLVYAMRPPALDELGLVPALRQQAADLRTEGGSRLQVTIAADEIPTTVTAAIEVAAYRIVMEALTNVARHSGCDAATVRLRVECGELVIDVTDSGRAHGAWSTGVGLASMRERAAQVGGTLTAGSDESGGRVHATVPL